MFYEMKKKCIYLSDYIFIKKERKRLLTFFTYDRFFIKVSKKPTKGTLGNNLVNIISSTLVVSYIYLRSMHMNVNPIECFFNFILFLK